MEKFTKEEERDMAVKDFIQIGIVAACFVGIILGILKILQII